MRTNSTVRADRPFNSKATTICKWKKKDETGAIERIQNKKLSGGVISRRDQSATREKSLVCTVCLGISVWIDAGHLSSSPVGLHSETAGHHQFRGWLAVAIWSNRHIFAKKTTAWGIWRRRLEGKRERECVFLSIRATQWRRLSADIDRRANEHSAKCSSSVICSAIQRKRGIFNLISR